MERKWIRIIKKTAYLYHTRQMPVYSGYAALYILTAMVPMLVLILLTAVLLPGLTADDMIYTMERWVQIGELRDLLEGIFRNLRDSSGNIAVSVSIVTLFWTVSRGVIAIQNCLEHIRQNKSRILAGHRRAFIFTLLYILLMPSLLVFRLLGSSIKALAVALLEKAGLQETAAFISSFLHYSSLISLAAMMCILWLTYTYLPAGKRKLTDQLPGAVFSSVLWVVFTAGFAYWIPRFWRASVIYGSLAAIVIVILWLKILMMILLLGAALNEALLEEKQMQETCMPAEEPV